MHDERIVQLQTRLFERLTHGGLYRRFIAIDGTGHEIVGERYVPSDQATGTEFIDEHDLVAIGIVGQHADGMAPMHDFADDALTSAGMQIGFELNAFDLEKPVRERCR